MGDRITGLAAAALIAVLAVSACGPGYVMDTPERFAHFEKEKRFLKFISAEGVRVKASAVKNEPYGDVAMWMNAAGDHLKSAGYHRQSLKDIGTSGNMKGSYSEYLYHFNAENYVYALALFADRDHLYIVEAGGVKKDFDKRRDSILSAINSFAVK